MSIIPAYRSNVTQAGDSSQKGGRWNLRLLGPFAWGWAALITLAVMGYIGFLIAWVIGAFLAVMGGFFLAIALTHAARCIRRARGYAVLSYLENAVRLNFPLGPFLRAAARGEKGPLRRRLSALAGEMDNGAPIGDSVARRVPEISAHDAQAILTSEAIGQLQPTLARLVKQRATDTADANPYQAAVAIYPIIIGFAAILILTFLMIFVIPKFQEIFKEFQLQLPWLTRLLMAISHFFAEQFGDSRALWIFFSVVLLFILSRALRFTFAPWWPRLMFGPLADDLSWRIPLWRSFQRHRAMAEICHFLGDALRTGVDLPHALSEASKLHMNQAMRAKLLHWREGILAGQRLPAAARAAGFPRLMVGFLSTGQVGGHAAPDSFAGVFDFLARYYEQRFSRLYLTFMAVIEPVITLSLALLVGAIVLGFFIPLVSLIEGAMGSTPRNFL